jgi:Tfp pilus assembly protein PilF
VLLGFLYAGPVLASTDLHTSEQDVLQGRADRAIAGLRSSVSSDPANAAAHLLLCRAYLSEQHGPEAAGECQLALKTGLGNDSDAQDWAGRAFGLQAEHAGPIAGLKLAGQVRTAFQTAYRLNPRNPAAANDLGEYYINAPFIVGGGVDKAAALADALQPSLPEIAHRLRALLAEKRGDSAAAEREFLAAVAVANAPGALVDLSCFYVRQKDFNKGATAAHRAIAQDRTLDANVVDAASSLNDTHQTPQAIAALHSYLDHGRQSDQAPAFRVHTMLGEMLAAQGDRANARKEFQQALALAAGYAPAQKGLGSL